MSLGCMSMRARLVDALAGHASEAERLELEAHLDGCEDCRRHHAALGPVRALQGWDPPSLSEIARERVRRAALASVKDPASSPVASRSRLWWAGGGLGLAAAAALAIVALRPSDTRVLGGDVVVVGARAAPSIGDDARLRAEHGRVLLGGVDVELTGELVWQRAGRTITLDHGRVHVEVDPRRHQPFAVVTPRFRVDVLGTVFDVDLDGVRTTRGKVRVSGRDGTPLAEVAAGESWTVPAPVAAAPAVEAAATPAAIPAPAAAPVEAAAPARRAPSDDLSALLVAARRALARGDGAGARTMLVRARRGPRPLLAEARLLEAESFLIERRYRDAIARYRVVLRGYGDTAEAESALYAIAQLEVDSGRGEDAERALHRYLDRYPRGRFADEARTRLATLLSH